MRDLGTILVTGGAGFIGSCLVWNLNRIGTDQIIISDSLTRDEKWKNLRALRFVDYLESDTLLAELCSNRLKEVSTIFHLGAISATTEVDSRLLVQNNFEYSRILAEWALKSNKRFVYASSAATYGDGTRGMDDDIRYLHLLRPLNMYGYSKHLFDVHAKSKGWLNEIVGLKFFNIFGPNEYHKQDMRSVVNKTFTQISETGEATLFKSYNSNFRDGEQLRDFLYVKDAVSATIHLASNPSARGLFNIGSGGSSTWVSLITPVFEALKKPTNIRFVEMPDSIRNNYQYSTRANIGRLLDTGWNSFSYTLSDAVQEYVLDYLVPGRYLGDEDFE